MAETKASANNVPPVPRDPVPPAGMPPAAPDQTQLFPLAETPRVPGPAEGKEGDVVAGPAEAESKPAAAPPQPAPHPLKPNYIWVILPLGLLLALVLVILGTRRGQKQSPKNLPAPPQKSEEKQELSNYSAFIAQNKSLRVEKIADQFLTDDAFAGQAPLAVRSGGPLISSEIDPQLAALADAFRIRVQVMQGSQSLVRGTTATRTTKGDYRGFRVNALEKLENGVVVAEETRVESPRKALVKTVNHVLEAVQKTDFPGFLSEIRSAGLEISPAPVPAGRNIYRVQLRPVAAWRTPIAGELLISGKSVGRITLGMPVDRMKNQLLASYIILKRKVPINDVYYDVYKILDQGNEPLLYVYEKDGKVRGISIISNVFKTAKGIGIGNSLEQMRINYPIIKLAYSEKRTPFVQVDDVAGIFIVQGEVEKKIVSILVGDSPEFE